MKYDVVLSSFIVYIKIMEKLVVYQTYNEVDCCLASERERHKYENEIVPVREKHIEVTKQWLIQLFKIKHINNTLYKEILIEELSNDIFTVLYNN